MQDGLRQGGNKLRAERFEAFLVDNESLNLGRFDSAF